MVELRAEVVNNLDSAKQPLAKVIESGEEPAETNLNTVKGVYLGIRSSEKNEVYPVRNEESDQIATIAKDHQGNYKVHSSIHILQSLSGPTKEDALQAIARALGCGICPPARLSS